MIWFNVKKLERKLANDDFPRTLGYAYLIIFLSLLTFLCSLPEKSPASGNESVKILTVVLILLISFWGTNKIMEVNRNSGIRDFFKKFLALSFVNGVRLLSGLAVFLFLVKGIRYLLQTMYNFVQEGPLFGNLSKVFLASVLSILFFQMLVNSFRRINKLEEIRVGKR